MSYRNPLIIQNNPGGNIGQAANQAAASIQNSILKRMEDQERKAKEQEEARQRADALEIEQMKLSSTERDTARAALEGQAYSKQSMGYFYQSSEQKFKDGLTVADQNQDLSVRKAAQLRVNDENTFQSNQVSVNAALGEDKQSYDKLKLEKTSLYFNGPMGKAYTSFLDGVDGYKMEGKRNGTNWEQYIIDPDGNKFLLPVDKIKEGTWDGFVQTPDIYSGMRDTAKEYNTAISTRLNSNDQWQAEDFDKANVIIGDNVMKAQADFTSYLKSNQVKAEAFLENTLRIDKGKMSEYGFGSNKNLMDALTSGDGPQFKSAMELVNNEIRDDVESQWLSTNGVYRELQEDGSYTVKKYEAQEESGSASKENAKDTANRIITSRVMDSIVNDPDVDDKNSFKGAFFEAFPQPTKIGGSSVLSVDQTDTGFTVKLTKMIPNPNASSSGGEIDLSNFRQESSDDKTNDTINYSWDNSTHMADWIKLTGGKEMSDAARTAAAKKLVAQYKKFN